MSLFSCLPDHIIQEILVHIRPNVISPLASLDLAAMAERRRLDHLAWPQFLRVLHSFDRSFFVRQAPHALKRAYERIYSRRVQIDSVRALLCVNDIEGDEQWIRAIAWLRYTSIVVHTALRFRAYVGVEVAEMTRPLDQILLFCAVTSVPGRQFGVNRLTFLGQFFRWQAQATLCCVARHLFLSGHPAVAECVARLVLDEDWHRRALFSFARAILTSDSARAHQLLLQCIDLPTAHDAPPPAFAPVTAERLEPIGRDFGARFVERCREAIRVPTVSTGRQDEETIDAFVNERQWLFDLCDIELANVKSGGDTYLGMISMANVPRLVQRDWQTPGSIGYALAVMRDADNSQRAFDLARRLRDASPYPAERSTQGRLSKNELCAAALLGDRELYDARYAHWRARCADNDQHALRALLSDVITTGRIDLADALIAEMTAHHAAPELDATVATAIAAAARAASASTAEQFLETARPVLSKLVTKHKASLSAGGDGVIDRASQLNLWLELARASVALASVDELADAVTVLRSHFGKPMLRSLVDVCVALAEAQTTRVLATVERLQLKVAALRLVGDISALLAGRSLPPSLLVEVVKLCTVLLDLQCCEAAQELLGAHETALVAATQNDDDDESLASRLLLDLALVQVRLRAYASAAPLIARLVLYPARQSELIVSLGKHGHYDAAFSLLLRVPATTEWRADRLQQLSIDCAVALRTKRSWAQAFRWFDSLVEQPGWTFSERFTAVGGFLTGLLLDAQLDLYEDVDQYYSSASERSPAPEEAAEEMLLPTVAEIETALAAHRFNND
jgi:hypothetical protein